MRRLGFVALALLSTACPRVSSDLLFGCTASGDCPPGQVCDRSIERCVAPADAGDAGIAAPDASEEPDASEPADAADSEMSCSQSGEHAWCYAATTEELEARARDHQADIIDIEIEPGDFARRYAAVFAPRDGIYRRWLFEMLRVPEGNGFTFPETFAGTSPLHLEPFDVSEGWSRRAGVFTSRGARCAILFSSPSPTAEAIHTAVGSNVPSIEDIDRGFIGGEERAFVVARPGPPSTILMNTRADTVLETMAAMNLSVLSFSRAPSGALDVTLSPRSAAAPERFWEHSLTAAELETRAIALDAHVVDLDIQRIGNTRFFSAILERNTSTLAERRAESRRVAALGLEVVETATISIYVKQRFGSPLLHSNERAQLPVRSILGPFYAIDGLRRIQDLEQEISIPASCTDPTEVERLTLRAALERLVIDGAPADAKGVFESRDFGLAKARERALRYALHATSFEDAPGCETAERPSSTSVLDQALLYETGVYCDMDAFNTFMGWMRARDPSGFAARLTATATTAAVGANFTPAQAVAYAARLSVAHAASELTTGTSTTRMIAGVLDVPRCELDATGARNVSADEQYFFGVAVQSDADPARVEGALLRIERELIRLYVEPAIALGPGSCFAG